MSRDVYRLDVFLTRLQSMADVKKPRTFRKFSYRGVDLEGLVELDFEKVALLFLSSDRLIRFA